MRRPLLLALLACRVAGAAVLAEAAFTDGPEQYQGTPYFWLGNGPLTITIATPPAPGQRLFLHWGAKADQRSSIVVIDGVNVPVSAGGYDGFQWVEVPLPDGLAGDGYAIKLTAGGAGKAAFLAGVKLDGDPLPAAPRIAWSQPQPGAAWPELRARWDRLPPEAWFAGGDELWRAAEANSRVAGEALERCRLFVDGWLAVADPVTGLLPQRLGKPLWEPHNSAADNYPFLVLTCALTDRAMFDGVMRTMLDTERRVTNRVGVLPDVYNLETHGWQYPEVRTERLMFGASEYIKDGLLPLTEWLGESVWSQRMIELLDAMWAAAPVRTPSGRIISDNVEVNGEMLQTLSRLYWFTGRREYLDYAIRLGDYYLLGDHHPTRDLRQLRLRDHGCEVVSGLCELYATCWYAAADKAAAYRAPLHEMLDRILEVGRNEHGLFYNAIDPVAGAAVNAGLADTWGYNLNGFYTAFLIDGTPTYREAVLTALRNLPHYRNYAWEGRSHDGYADSIESALNLYNREPEAAAASWIDSETKVMFAMQQDNGRIGDWYGDGNFARTAIMVALWKSQGVTVQPWRADVRVGAVRDGQRLLVQVAADQPWQGRVIFDRPRHRENLRLPQDWPRINQFPEWFTVTAEGDYVVARERGGSPTNWRGEDLRRGLEVRLQGGDCWRRVVAVREP